MTPLSIAKKGLALILAVVLALNATMPCGALRTHLARIFVTNGLEGSINLTLHCKSKTEDRGFHELVPGGTWEFEFHPRWWGHTLYFCRFMWHGIDYRYFDIYEQFRDQQKCNNCCWTIKSDGPCRCPCFGQPCTMTKCLPWKPR